MTNCDHCLVHLQDKCFLSQITRVRRDVMIASSAAAASRADQVEQRLSGSASDLSGQLQQEGSS